MAITEEDFDSFVKKWGEIANRYPIVLKDKERFKELSQKRAFIDENNVMYILTSKFLHLAPEYTGTLPPVALIEYLNKFEIFVEKWKTKPISCWLFNTEIGDLKKGMEKLFDSISRYHVIKIYPWTTKKEVERKFDEIRNIQPHLPLRPEMYPTNFRIKALRDASWRWPEIIEFLRSGVESDDEFLARIEKRTEELTNQGKSKREIERSLDEEFPFDDFDKAIDSDLKYDALRKREKAANDLCDKILQFLTIGK